MPDNSTDVDINIAVDGTASLRTAANALAAINDSLKSVGSSLGSAISGIDKLEKSLAGVSKQRSGIESLTAATKEYYKVANTTPTKSGVFSETAAQQQGSVSLQSANGIYYRDMEGQFISTAKAASIADAALAKNRENLDKSAAAYGRVTEANHTFGSAIIDSRTRMQKFNDGLRDINQNASTTRYALYDVSQSFAVLGAGLLSVSVASAAVAIQYERDFANVIRTSQDGTIGISELRDELIGLTEDIPIAFSEITEIATLGGQLGIAGKDLDEFTSVVARLAATTDLSAEAAGTALGRFQALLGVPGDEFENLASSILKVGVNSVATESQIVAISTQISSMADFAGFTADQVVGLAGALASVGAAPELSRGTITRVFSLMSKAIAGSTEQLDGFARISGVSAAEFEKSFGTSEFAGIFQKFLIGLESINDAGGNAVIELNNLGISSVRDVPLLLRLAGAQDTVTRAFIDSATAYAEATELQDQYGIIADTTASKIQLLINSVTNLLDALGSGATGPIKDVVDMLAEMVQNITEFVKTDAGQRITVVVLALTALAGVLALTVSGLALSAAGYLAVQQALIGLGLRANTATISLTATELAARRTALAFNLLKGAAIAAGVIAAITFLPDITEQGKVWADEVRGIDRSFVPALGRLAKASDEVAKQTVTTTKTYSTYAGGTYTAGKVTEDLSAAQIQAAKDANTLWNSLLSGRGVNAELKRDFESTQKALIELANTGDVEGLNSRLTAVANAFGITTQEVIKGMPDLGKALANGNLELTKNENGVYSLTTKLTEFSAVEEIATARAEELATQLGLLPEELDNLKTNLTSGSAGFVQFGDLIQRVQDKTRGWAEEESKEKYDSKDSWQEWYDGSSVNIYDFMTLLDQQINAQAVWADDLAELSARGANAFVSELAKMGPEGAPLAAAAVNLTAEELFRLEDQARLAAFLASTAFAETFTENQPALIAAYKSGGIAAVQALITAQRENPVPPITPTVDTEPARSTFNKLLQDFPKSVTVRVDMVPGGGAKLGTGQFANKIVPLATGGPVSGPGTGTSDTAGIFALSNNEYVVKAKSAEGLGLPVMNYINKYGRLPGFATGGSVGGGTTTVASIGSGIVELGPTSLGILRQALAREIAVYLDGSAVGRSVNEYNANQARRGAN